MNQATVFYDQFLLFYICQTAKIGVGLNIFIIISNQLI